VLIRAQGSVATEVYIDNVISSTTTLDSWISGNFAIDDMRVYRRSLLDSEVSQLYIPVLAKNIHPASTPGVTLEEIIKNMQSGNMRKDDLTGLLGLIAHIS
jgi:hypothetical protein